MAAFQALKLSSQILAVWVPDSLTSDQYPRAKGLSADVQDKVKKLCKWNIDERLSNQ